MISLVAVDCVYVDQTIEVMQRCMNQFVFRDAYLFTHTRRVIKGVTVITIPQIKSIEAYSEFMILDLPNYRAMFEDHILTVQYDGYIVRPDAWTGEFLKYDYIGAPWCHGAGVGNGGFSLRGQRLLYALTKINPGNPHPEDWRICVNWREELQGHGVKFAPIDLARRFSVENEPYVDSFGFHGKYTQGTLK